MQKEITYLPVNFTRLSAVTNSVHKDNKKVELLADVASDVGVTHKKKMLRYIRNTVIVALVAFTILFRYTMVSDNKSEIRRLEKEYVQLSEANINLQCEIDSCTDSDSIEEAATKLGMSQPSKSQKITVDVVGGDYVEVAVSQPEENRETSQFYGTMIETLGNVLEYLY